MSTLENWIMFRFVTGTGTGFYYLYAGSGKTKPDFSNDNPAPV